MVRSKSAQKTSHRRNRVLLIEDDTFLSGMYIAKMTLEHLDVLLANDGQEGIEMAQKYKPDLILLDLLLPKVSGFEVLKYLKRSQSLKKIPVILLTNLSQQEDIKKAMKYEIAGYLIKAHFMPSEVIENVKQVLKKEKFNYGHYHPARAFEADRKRN